MNFLITGGAGFLGAALSNRLLQQGHHVRVLDDLSTGNPDALDPEIHFTRGDINDRPKLWTLLQDIDCIYHLAARVSVSESILFPRDYNEVNVGGTATLMEAARDAGTPRVILTSSGAVYGEQEKPLLIESMHPHPGSPYAVSKLASEWYVRSIGALSGIETICLRIFNAYGPGQRIPPSHPAVIPNFIRQSMQNGTLIFHGDVDTVVPWPHAGYMAAMIPETEFHLLPNVGHMVMAERPEFFNETLANWAKGAWEKTKT